jgi:hypothetical protein
MRKSKSELDIWEFEQAAYELFREIMSIHGVVQARRIFLEFGRPPTKRKLARIKNYGLLDRLDLMSKPNVEKLAREIADGVRGVSPEEYCVGRVYFARSAEPDAVWVLSMTCPKLLGRFEDED